MTGLGLLTRGMLGGSAAASGETPTVYVYVAVGRLRGRLRPAAGVLRGRVKGA